MLNFLFIICGSHQKISDEKQSEGGCLMDTVLASLALSVLSYSSAETNNIARQQPKELEENMPTSECTECPT
jgi:hypothetical protein